MCVLWETWWVNQIAWPNIHFIDWMEGGEREENGEAWVSCESVSKISVYLHKGCVCVCVCECECGVCVCVCVWNLFFIWELALYVKKYHCERLLVTCEKWLGVNWVQVIFQMFHTMCLYKGIEVALKNWTKWLTYRFQLLKCEEALSGMCVPPSLWSQATHRIWTVSF